jgi:hypothetical protein
MNNQIESFGTAIKAVLDHKIDLITGDVRRQAIDKLSAEIDKLMANIAIEIFEHLSVERFGRELVMRIDTAKIKALKDQV